MPVKLLLILICFLFIWSLNGQSKFDKVYISFGYSAVPLQIKRTAVTRWMIFPTFEAAYRINEKFSIHASYLGQDITLKNLSPERQSLYTEVPPLTSYDMALMYSGRKFTVSLFHDYIFCGLLYEHYRSNFFNLQSNLQLGYRFGETFLLTNISESPSRPNGFEVHPTILSSNSPGIKLAISPKIVWGNCIFIEVSLGSFIFINWPTFQPFGNAKIGVSF